MPDLATHVAGAWLTARAVTFARPIPGRSLYLFALGSALPDLLARAPHLLLRSALVERITRPLHTPSVLLLLCLSASFLFESGRRGACFAALFLGALHHCFLDFCQEIGPAYGYAWLYPLSDLSPQLGLFPGEETVLWLPFVLGAALLAELCWQLRPARSRSSAAGARAGEGLGSGPPGSPERSPRS